MLYVREHDHIFHVSLNTSVLQGSEDGFLSSSWATSSLPTYASLLPQGESLLSATVGGGRGVKNDRQFQIPS